MRSYPDNSTEALARIMSVAIFADGTPDPRELAVAQSAAIQARLGYDTAQFQRVMAEFCTDLAAIRPPGADTITVTPRQVSRMLGEVTDAAKQDAVCRSVFDVIRADRRAHAAETGILREMIHHWRSRDAD